MLERISSLRVGAALFSAAMLLFGTGCPSEAQKVAQKGVDLLAQCDMRGAHAEFEKAVDLDSADPDIALAFALTDLVFLAEDPALEELLPRFGFTKPFDTTWLWKKGGLLDGIAKGTSCDAMDDLIRANVAHPSVEDGGPDYLSTFDPSLTFGELRAVAVKLRPRFTKLSRAFALAAENIGPAGVELEGGCGVGHQVLQKPELLALSAAFETLNAVVSISEAYDGDVAFTGLLRSVIDGKNSKETADNLNAHLLRVVKASALTSGRGALRDSLSALADAVGAAQAARIPPPNAIIDWSAFPLDILVDSGVLVDGAREALDSDDFAIPFVTPRLGVNGASFFEDPFAIAPTALFSPCSTCGEGFEADWDQLEKSIGARFSPDPFDTKIEFEWKLEDKFSKTKDETWLKVFDPRGHWSSAYSCDD